MITYQKITDILMDNLPENSPFDGRIKKINDDIFAALEHEETHGYWIERTLDNFRKYEVKCSECGFVGIGNYDQYLEPCDFNYCPRCGARMDREVKNGM
jgi:hypothetical protein